MRKFRFSLKTLLVATILFSIPVAWCINRAEQQKRAVRSLFGGTVYANHGGWIPETSSNWLHRLVGIDYFDAVRTISANETVEDLSPRLSGRGLIEAM